MSATILWCPVKRGKPLSISTPSDFIEAVGGLPRTVIPSEIAFFEGLAAGRPDWREAVREIIRAVGEHGAINLKAEY